MAPIGGRADPYVDRDIKDRSPYAPYELALGMGGHLEMQSAKNAFLSGMNVAVLHEGGIHPRTDE